MLLPQNFQAICEERPKKLAIFDPFPRYLHDFIKMKLGFDQKF